MSDTQMRDTLKELEQAIYNHEQWAENLYGTLICRIPPDTHDISSDAHQQCRFGQWYYKGGQAALSSFPGFAEIGREHQSMHQHAAHLLRASAEGVPISIPDYERFVTALKRLRLEIMTLRHEIEGALFNLDPLTGTPSRVSMLSRLREMQELARRDRACTLAMMDLDKFKSVNDRYGHPVGDTVLASVARYMTSHLRPYDRIFRYGGEEFLICLADADLEAARLIVERWRQELAALPFEAVGKGTFHVTVSFGITLLDPDVPVERSIDRADKALYVAKNSGRNRVVAWDKTMDDATTASQ
jgi:diguanylate cyclase (GGDEF)-like protein